MCSTFESSLGHRTPALNGELFNPTEWFKMEKKMEVPSKPRTGSPPKAVSIRYQRSVMEPGILNQGGAKDDMKNRPPQGRLQTGLGVQCRGKTVARPRCGEPHCEERYIKI